MANDMIRMSGMNSGLDTESIINALTANTKLKATKQERNVLKYEATQEAYRDIISKMQSIKNKYFDILNKDTYLSGASIWNKYSATTYVDGVEKTVAGLSVATTINSQPGDYNIKVEKNATQTKIKGTTLTSTDKPDLKSTAEGGTMVEGEEYGITVTVGGVEKNIVFTGGVDERESRKNLNQALEDAFGESNASATVNGVDGGVEGMVYVDSDTGLFVSREGKGISFSGIGTMQNSQTLDYASVATGRNTFSLQVGDEVVNVSFQSIDKDYFKDILDEDGNLLDDDALTAKATTAARAELGDDASTVDIINKSMEIKSGYSDVVSLYNEVVDDYKTSVRYAEFQTWATTGDGAVADADNKTGLDRLYESVEKDHRDGIISGWLAKEDSIKSDYTEYQNSFATEKLSDESKDAYEAYKTEKEDAGETAVGIYEWAQDNETAKAELTAAASDMKSVYQFAQSKALAETGDDKPYTDKLAEFDAEYDGKTETDAELYEAYAKSVITGNDAANAAYNAYKSTEGNENVGYYEWVTGDGAEDYGSLVNVSSDDYNSWKEDRIETKSWHLDRSMWEGTDPSSSKKVFDAYVKYNFVEDESKYDLSPDKLVDHFNVSAVKNSIGNLNVSGTKFDVNFSSSTGKISIEAYKDTTQTADDGTTTTVKTPVAFSVSAADGSANTFGTKAATNTVTQINTSTKLSELGVAADENGKYNFTINGVDFSFDGDTTVSDMTKKVNASSAGVKMTFSSLENSFTVTSNTYGVDGDIKFGDTNGLLAKIGLSEDTKEKGSNLKVSVQVGDDGQWKSYETSGNSIEVDGTTFTISNKMKEGSDPVTVTIGKDTSAIKDLIKNFVKDYNQLIEDVYKYLDEKPEKDYYFLTDTDKEDLDLTEKQEEKWEEKSKKGLLYHDNITSTVMTSLRTSLMGTVEGLDGNIFSLSAMGIKTMTDYNQHGKFAEIDETALDNAIENHLDDIQKLFSDSENGIMKKFSAALDSGVGTTGENKGSLIRKAGLATGSTAMNNEIYNAIKRTKSRITSLNARYESEQDRLWKRYSSMESMLGTLNSQQASFSSYFMQ